MPRNVPWRRNLNDFVCASQAFAANATIYILRQTGPTGFLLKEEGELKDVKVFLGDPHSCTCPAFRKEKDLCKHICWVLLKKFRMNRDDPLSWQLGLSEMEINEVLRGPVIRRRQQQQQQQHTFSRETTDASEGRPMVAQRDISDDDVCPICQDELLEKKLPVTYCKFGCGNNVHMKCMKVWAEHQLKTSKDQVIKCPMCREDFGPITLLKQEMRNAAGSDVTSPAVLNPNRMDRHVGLGCSNCRVAPIEGKCYRCGVCADFYLCQACFNTPAHTHHSFQFRHKRNQRWRNAQRTLGAALPDAIINNMMNRDLSESDYDLLLQLDNTPTELSDLTDEVVQTLPVERVRERGALLVPGAQCRVCLRGFQEGQLVRKLPCQHKFHKECIDGWLLHTRPTCPIDGSAVFTNRPHSDTNNRRAGRHPNLSAGSAWDTASIISGHSRRDEVRSLSVPALGVTAVRLGGSGEGNGQREGERGLLMRRPPRDPPYLPHKPPARLELTGTRVGGDEGNGRTEMQVSSVIPPGSRLLHQAMQRRARLNQHLADLVLDNSFSPPLTEGQQAEFADEHTSNQAVSAVHACEHQVNGHFVEASPLQVAAGLAAPDGLFEFPENGSQRRSTGYGSSHAERMLNRRQPPNPRTSAGLRQRSNSHDRTGATFTHSSSMQDLYLGNDPRLIPPPIGDVTAARDHHTNTGVIRRGAAYSRHQQAAANRRKNRTNNRGADIALEGSGLESLTLRDLL